MSLKYMVLEPTGVPFTGSLPIISWILLSFCSLVPHYQDMSDQSPMPINKDWSSLIGIDWHLGLIWLVLHYQPNETKGMIMDDHQFGSLQLRLFWWLLCLLIGPISKQSNHQNRWSSSDLTSSRLQDCAFFPNQITHYLIPLVYSHWTASEQYWLF